MRGLCQSNSAYRGMHEPYVEGTPRSAMTWYVCRLCGQREPRGMGAFYGQPTWEAPTLEQRVKKLEDAMKSSNVEHNRRPQGVRVDGPVGPHTQEG